ncbi:DUF2933 domain-containing protein [Octadecabacter sp. R77987]|uniref:DUF2933 domain-containing protein n=1 Tax=Octadecabacter sp. R77987 TaxID=3093874 RepID=UPI00366D6F27
MKWGMMACCAVMFLPVAVFLIGGGTLAGLWANAGVFAPLTLCIGAHLVMHKMMGKSCHAEGESSEAEQDGPTSADLNHPNGKHA